MSPNGARIHFSHEGTVNSSTNEDEVTVQPLTPQSPYVLKLSAITPRGQGEEIVVEANTAKVESEFGMSLM